MKRTRELDYLPVAKIVKNERNPRDKTAFGLDALASLRKSVERHGFLQPLIVQPYNDDEFLLIEGERRLTVANQLGIKEVPAIIVNRMKERDQLTVMFNVHTQRKGWEVAEELLTIKELREQNPDMTEDDLARDLGISVPTLRDRLQVLGMGEPVITAIAKDDIEYSSALRADQIAKSLARKRPQIAERLGGTEGVKSKLLDKAKARKRGGISQELVAARKDLTDPEALPDDLVEAYVSNPNATLRDVRQQAESLEERRKVENLAKELRRVTREIQAFQVDLAAAPNLRDLRKALGVTILAATELERNVVKAIYDQETQPGR
jgi:ParB/RepB/Spo0J family partition protein